jgi:hypothetical protein
MLKLPLQ